MTGPLAAASLAAALLLWPRHGVARERLVALRSARSGQDRPQPTRWSGWWLPVCAAFAVGSFAALAAEAVLLGMVAGAATLAGARWWLSRSGKARPERTDPLAMAAAWDVLAACLRAGLPVPHAVRVIAAELDSGAADELRKVADLLALGADADTAWAAAARHPDLARLARAARHTARSGAALADLATGLGSQVRSNTEQAAEAKAQRAAVLITGPLGACFLPAFLCLGIIPVVIGLANHILTTW